MKPIVERAANGLLVPRRIAEEDMPTDRWTRFLLAPALVFIATAMDRNYQTDLWHHLARGRAILAEGRLIDTDYFTYTVHGRSLQDVNWVWQVSFFQLHELGGLPLVQSVNSAILAVMMAILITFVWRRCGSMTAAMGGSIFAFLGLWQMLIIRPQTVSLLLFVILYAVLQGAGRRHWLLYLPPLLMAVWVNVHGGFPIGLLLIGCYVVAAVLPSADRPPGWKHLEMWLRCLAASVAATCANPYGWRVYEYVLLTSNSASGRHIDEWLPPSQHSLTGMIWVLSLLALIVLFGLSRRRPRWSELCLIACFLPLSCGSVRMVAWWLLVCTPILAAQLAELWPRMRQLDAADDRPSLGNALACGALLGAMVLSLPWVERFNPVLTRPGRAHRTETDLQAIANYLRAEEHGQRLFTRFAWGEYFGWSLAPRFSIFMDGRIEIIPDEVWLQYSAITRGRADWEDILAHYDVDYLVLDTSGYHHDLLPLVEQSPRWQRVRAGGTAILYRRKEPPAAERQQSAQHNSSFAQCQG